MNVSVPPVIDTVELPAEAGIAIVTLTTPFARMGKPAHPSGSGRISPELQNKTSPVFAASIRFPFLDIAITTGQCWEVIPPSTFPVAGPSLGDTVAAEAAEPANISAATDPARTRLIRLCRVESSSDMTQPSFLDSTRHANLTE
jgi:hypothetical protein